MPTLARPDVDVLEGLTTAIIVDQERMGANPRSTVGTVTDANAMLRILFSRLGQPHIGSPQAFSFNVPRSGRGRGHRRARRAEGEGAPRLQHHRRHVPALRGRGPRSTTSTCPRSTTTASRSTRGPHDPRLQHGGLVRPHLPRLRLLRPGQADPRVHQEGTARPAPQGATKIKVEGINLTYLGLIPQIQKSFLSKDVEAMQPHIRAFVERAVTFTTCPECGGTRLRRRPGRRRSRGSASPTPARCRSATSPAGCAASTNRRWRRCWGRWARPSTRSWRSGWATCRSTGRRARCRAARRSAPR